jgi:CheY-like chemotaxis protein
MTGQRVLVVEDHPITGMDMMGILRDLGYEVTSLCLSGESAISRVGEGKPDVVLMDIMLSGDMNGIKAARIIKEKFGTPIVFVTAYGVKGGGRPVGPPEGYSYVVKPFTIAELSAAIESVLP